MNRKLYLIFIALWFNSYTACAANLTAQADRYTISENETFQLILTSDSNINADPDTKILASDFDLIATAKSNQLTQINNQTQTATQWFITLAPKRTGKLTIPALSVGQLQSQPLTITVTDSKNLPNKSNAIANKVTGAFLEAELSTNQTYVQGQLTYIVRLLYRNPLQSGTMTDPSANDVTIFKLGRDITYHQERSGQRYEVLERRYALFPQVPGKVTVKPVTFLGQLEDLNANFNNLDQFFNNSGRMVRLIAPTLQFSVLPKPATLSSATWLPAHSLKLSEAWSINENTIKVGEPFTRTITLEAIGITPNQLPAINIERVNNTNVYPDKPQTETTADDNWVISKRVIKIAFIPTQVGTITIPGIQISWWNTQAHKMEVASLPARTYQVSGSVATASHSNPVNNQTITNSSQDYSFKNSIKSKLKQLAPVESFWILFAPVGVLLLGIICWLIYRRLFSQSPKHSPINVRKAVKQACKKGDAQLTKQTLLAWANHEYPAKNILNLGELAELITDQGFKKAILNLDKLLYSGKTAQWDNSDFLVLFSRYHPHQPNTKKSNSDPLPKLYLDD